jgi:uncharacterized membrane protein
MFERTYRQRLEADLARWQAEGVITPAIGDAMRNSLVPLDAGVNIAVVVGIVGGLLIAAAFLAFVAANWTEIARPARFAILLTGIAGAHGVGAWFAGNGRPVLADLAAGVGAIIFGAAIALVGQMYHLGDDFAAGMLLWSMGALAAATLTGSRGALAVALVAGTLWTGTRAIDASDIPHLPFVLLWLFAAALAVAWNSKPAAHLVAIAALAWWIAAAIGLPQSRPESVFVIADGAALLLGAGLLLANTSRLPLRSFGLTLSAYGAFALAVLTAIAAVLSNDVHVAYGVPPAWAYGCGVVGLILAFAAAALGRRAGPAFAGISIALVLVVIVGWVQPASDAPWLAYGMELGAMLCLVASGMLDESRARVVAGWLGLAAVFSAITWAVKGSLLRRSVFLAVAGAAAIVLAIGLGRLMPRESRP